MVLVEVTTGGGLVYLLHSMLIDGYICLVSLVCTGKFMNYIRTFD